MFYCIVFGDCLLNEDAIRLARVLKLKSLVIMVRMLGDKIKLLFDDICGFFALHLLSYFVVSRHELSVLFVI